MIRDLVIIKDGVPLLSKKLCNYEKSVFAQENDLIMLSGFFSALNSFGNQFKNLGSISELKLSNSNLKLSFLNDTNIQNMVFLATFDQNSNSVDVKRFLYSVSQNFSKRFGAEQIIKWAGRREIFESFEEVVEDLLEDDDKDHDNYNNNESTMILDSKSDLDQKIPDYYDYIPYFKISTKINPEHYLTGESSYNVFNKIDSRKSISQIADELDMDKERVYAICKNLIKFGFISFS
jgi:hypothetical protein